MSFADHFSTQATDYAKYRPGYPRELFDWLRTLTPTHDLAWDVGTGNGQAAVELAKEFTRVVATDPSAAQISNAMTHECVEYRVQAAEACDLPDRSVDLVTIAQALHWFDFERFYAQVHRVLKPGGVVAAWTYTLNEVTAPIDAVVRHFYSEVIGPYWPPERRYIEERYRTLPFPFEEIAAPTIHMTTDWTLSDYVGYLQTWSATQAYKRALHHDPIARLLPELRQAWGDAEQIRRVHWPMSMRAGRC